MAMEPPAAPMRDGECPRRGALRGLLLESGDCVAGGVDWSVRREYELVALLDEARANKDCANPSRG